MKKIDHRKIVDLIPVIISATTIFISQYLSAYGKNIWQPVVPLSWGIIKGFLDVLILLIFTWDGWVFMIPLVASLHLRWNPLKVASLWISVSIFVGVIHTFIAFDSVNVGKVVSSVLTFSLISVLAGLIAFLFYISIERFLI